MNKKVTVFLLLLSLLPAGLAPGHTGTPQLPPALPATDRSVMKGEELLYEVSWWIVKLGTIRMRVVEAGRDSGGALATVRADIDTYEELPFTSLHAVSETAMDSQCYSLSSLGVSRDGDAWRTIRYAYDTAQGRLFVEHGTTSGRDDRQFAAEKIDTLAVDSKFQDGLSIFYFARAQLLSGREMTVPTIIEGRKGRIVFDFYGDRSDEEIDAVDYPIDVVGFRGTMEFSGIYGLTGPFEGWFSNDDARVPIRANMEVMLGSVKVELVGWNRDGWTPPRHPDD